MPLTPAERSARYREKDVDAYRTRKAEFARREDQKEKRRLYMIEWRKNNREKHNRFRREYYLRNKDTENFKNRRRHHKDKYNLTIEGKEAMMAAQGGLCLICQTAFKSFRLAHVDHCHTSGEVRGILCNRCNTQLGWFEKYAEAARAYLEKTKG